MSQLPAGGWDIFALYGLHMAACIASCNTGRFLLQLNGLWTFLPFFEKRPIKLNITGRKRGDGHLKIPKHLRKKAIWAVVAILAIIITVSGATFAWYVYNTNAHTTNVHMAAGTGATLQISSSYDGAYGYTAIPESFTGVLNPVSTDSILSGFQKVYEFTEGRDDQPGYVAGIFGKSEASDYYMTSLFIRNNGNDMKIYVSDILYEDDDSDNPISTAIRVGIVAHEPGQDKKASAEYIFSVNEEKNPKALYNTATGRDGYVLDSSRDDGTTVAFTPYNSDNYCNYDENTGETSLKSASVPICQVSGDGAGNYGEAVQLDLYIWLEGCDADCADNLSERTLKNLSILFAGL